MGKRNLTAAALCLAVALAAGAASAAGVFLRGDGSTAWATSVRGERYEYAVGGVYAYNSVRVVAEGVGWDYVTLLLAAPAMAAAAVAVARGSFRGRLLALGLFAYFFYQYLEYATYWAFGPLFPLFVALFAASLAGMALLASGFDLKETADRFEHAGRRRFPLKGMAVLCLAMSALLILMWGRMILDALNGKIDGTLFGQTTLVVQAYDLGLIVPIMVFTAVAALKRMPVAYLLCPVFAVKAVAMASAVCAMLLSAWAIEGKLDAAQLAAFGSAGAASLALAARMFASVKRTESS